MYKYEKTTGAHELQSDGKIPQGSVVIGRELPVYSDLIFSIQYDKEFNENLIFSSSYHFESYKKNISYPYYNGTFPTLESAEEFEWSNPKYHQSTALLNLDIASHNLLIGMD